MVFHLAAAVGVELIVESPVRTIETNVHGTEVVLAQASKKKKKVLIASTSEVYGKSDEFPFREDGDLVLGATDQGALELRLLEGHRRVPGAGLLEGDAAADDRRAPVQHRRPAADRPYGMVVPTFVRRRSPAQPLTVYGDGTQTRCFCHVGDVVGALVDLIEHPDAVGEVFNIGSTEEISIGSWPSGQGADRLASSEIVLVPYGEAYEEGFEDMPRRVPDTSKVKNLVGFRTTHDTRQVVQSVIDYFSPAAKPRRTTKKSPATLRRRGFTQVLGVGNSSRQGAKAPRLWEGHKLLR